MGRTYSIYGHPKQAEIETDILSGKSVNSIANNYGLSISSVRRYKEKVMPERMQKAEIKSVDDIIDRLNKYMSISAQMHSSLREMLEDPDDPYTLIASPMPEDIKVIYKSTSPDGKTVRKADTLKNLIDMIQEAGLNVVKIEMCGEDPRKLLLRTQEIIAKQLELFAKIKGQVVDTKVEVRAVTASASEIVDKIRVALKPYPGAIEAVSDILCPNVLPFDEEDMDD